MEIDKITAKDRRGERKTTGEDEREMAITLSDTLKIHRLFLHKAPPQRLI